MSDQLNDLEYHREPGAFWAWANAAYGRPGAADSLLAAQDRAGLNVNIALWTCWTATIFDVAPESAIRSAIELVSNWNASVTKNLRAARRAAKPFAANPEFSGARDLRIAIKTAELDAERIEIGCLERLAHRILTPAAVGDVVDRAKKNLECYAALDGAHRQNSIAAELLRTVIDRIFDAPLEKTPSAGEREPS